MQQSGSHLAGGDVNTAILTAKLGRHADESGQRETTDQLLDRVADGLAQAEARYGASAPEIRDHALRFRTMMSENRFWPSGRILNNCGARQGQLSSCFVLPLPDDFSGIFDTLKLAGRCHQGGGGTGFDLSPIRERGARISSAEAAGASGPISWLTLFDAETSVVMDGGKMRGANLASLDVRHPDILDFIRAKSQVGRLPNFNLSVAVDDSFMATLESHGQLDLTSPHSGRVVRRVPASEIWQSLCECAWSTGDPGLLFVDTINRGNRLAARLGPIRTTNPCGEQTLYPYEPSNLGSVNLAAFCRGGGLDWAGLEQTVRDAVRLLDNAVDVNHYPDPRVAAMAFANRRLGLGVMGFADVLVHLGVPYDSAEALDVIDQLGGRIRTVAWAASRELAADRGVFSNWHADDWDTPVRNCAVTTIAPTGTISMVAGCSSGIEPRFAASWNKDVLSDDGIDGVDRDLVADVSLAHGISREEAVRLVRSGAELGLSGPAERKYCYAHDVSGRWHALVAARWQRYTDNGVSKTVNLSRSATAGDVDEVFRLAWQSGSKGICVYREGSRDRDLLTRQSHPEAAEVRQSKRLVAARGRD